MNNKNELAMPSMEEMRMIMEYCEIMAQAPAYQAMGGMPGVFAVVMSAKELGIGPMAALNGGMYLIPPGIDKEGKPKGSATIMMSARTMSMMIWKAGHKIEEIECNDRVVTLKGTRADNGVSMTVTMTMEKAKQAGLSHDIYGKPKLWSTWFKNSEDMLWKTCIVKLGRRLFTDVTGNCYEPAEFEEKASEPEKNKQKKTLIGKNICSATKNEKESLDETLEESFEEFIKTHQICDPNKQKENNVDIKPNDISMYIQFIADIKKISFEECCVSAYENKEKFFEQFKIKMQKMKQKNSDKDE